VELVECDKYSAIKLPFPQQLLSDSSNSTIHTLYNNLLYAEVFPSQFIYINKKLLLTALFTHNNHFSLTFPNKYYIVIKY